MTKAQRERAERHAQTPTNRAQINALRAMLDVSLTYEAEQALAANGERFRLTSVDLAAFMRRKFQ